MAVSASRHMHELPGMRFRDGSKWVRTVLVSLLEVSLLEGVLFSRIIASTVALLRGCPWLQRNQILDFFQCWTLHAWYQEELHGGKESSDFS